MKKGHGSFQWHLGFILPVLVGIAILSCQKKPQDSPPPNVLFISIDDLNDWTGFMGGHPQAFTPNLDSFASESMTFLKNYCTSPGCNPSRSTLMTGLHTYTSGMYSNYQDWRSVPKMANAKTIGSYFREHGYYSAGAGKIFHYSQVDTNCWDNYFPSQTKNMPDDYLPSNRPVNMIPFKYMYSMFDWAATDVPDDSLGDVQSVNYIIDQLSVVRRRPFFLACGIYRPHLPWYVPQRYYDLFPIDSIQLPEMMEDDLEDLSPRAKEIVTRGGNYHHHVTKAGQWKMAVQGYLASIAFADDMVGRLLKALKESTYANNTIVVIWSDHGWQLGEKMHWRKFALWENLIRTVLMIQVPSNLPRLPQGTIAGSETDNLTSLLDLYPTLVDLCNLPIRDNLDGQSLIPMLDNPDTAINRTIISTYDFGDYSIREDNWHYIRYIDDSEELYDLHSDPNEWYNLATSPNFEQHLAVLRSKIPLSPEPLLKETLIPLQEHHIPPITSREYYFSHERSNWMKRFHLNGPPLQK